MSTWCHIARCIAICSVVAGTLVPGHAVPALATPAAAAGPPAEQVIPVAPDPTAVAVDTATQRIFVAHPGLTTGRLTLIDARSARVLRQVSVGVAPTALAVDPRHGRLIVLNAGASDRPGTASLSLLDATSGALRHTVPAGARPNAVAVDEQRGWAILTTRLAGGAAVQIVDDVSGAIVQRVPLGQGVYSLALAVGGGYVVVGTSDDRVYVLALVGGHMRQHVVQAGRGIVAVAIDAAGGRAFILNQLSNTVSVVDLATGRLVRTVGVGVTPSALAINAQAQRVFVTNTAEGTVSVLDARSGALLRTIAVGTAPHAVLAAPAQGLLVVATSTGLSLLDATSGALLRRIAVRTGVEALAVDGGHARVVVADAVDNAVLLLATSTVPTRRAPAPAGASFARTRAVVQAFVAVYNAHDLSGALALLADPPTLLHYVDCDVTHHTEQTLQRKAAVAAWLRARFAEREQWLQARVGLFGPHTYPPNDPHGASLTGLRVSDALRARGQIGLLNAKIGLTTDGSRIASLVLSCPA